MNVVIFNGILMLVVIVFTKRTRTKVFIGIKMCERECQHLKGCYAFQYDTNSLECFILTDPKDELKGSPSITFHKLLRIKSTLLQFKTCSKGERMIVNRYHQHVCVSFKESFVGESALVSPWLLVVPYYNKCTTAFGMNVVTGEVKKCPFFWKHVWAVALMKAKNRYLISTNRRIISSPMTSRNDKILRSHVKVQHLCLDEKRGLVFLDVHSGKSHLIQQMTISGQNIKQVFKIEGLARISSIDIYQDQEKIYVTVLDGVISISYDGHQIKEVLTIDHSLMFLFAQYDIAQGTLYYLDKNTRALMCATRNRNPRVVKTSMIISFPCFALHDDMLYISKGHTNKISSLDLNNKNYPLIHALPNITERPSWNLFIL